MQDIPRVIPVSDIRYKHREVFESLDQGPIVLAQRSREAAVLVSVEEWRRIARRLHELEWREEVRQAAREADSSLEPDLSHAEFMAELNAYHEQT